MNHATNNSHFRYDTGIGRSGTKAAASTAMGIYTHHKTTQRRIRNQKGPTGISTREYAADGFLKCRFLPKLNRSETRTDGSYTDRMERDFYRSLSLLAAHYGIKPMETAGYGYPYNFALSVWDTERQLQQTVKVWDDLSVLQDRQQTFFETQERCKTGVSLYYIPVLPLYRMMQLSRRKPAALLLLSVYSYLYHVAAIPYYRKENSYLFWMYEMLNDWISYDDYRNDIPDLPAELHQSECIGDHMEQKIYNPKNLEHFGIRLEQFSPIGTMEHDIRKLAAGVYSLWKQCPNETLFRNARSEPDPNDDNDSVLTMERYISFCADGKGRLFGIAT